MSVRICHNTMPNRCIVVNCNTTHGFTFPKDELLRKQWIEAVRRENWSPTVNSLVCSAHFLPNDMLDGPTSFGALRRIRRRLKPDAVPSIFSWNQPLTEQNQNQDCEARVPPVTLQQDEESAQHVAFDKSRVKRRKIAAVKSHSSTNGAKRGHQVSFCQKHLAMPTALLLLHDYNGPVDMLTVVDSTKNEGVAVEDATFVQGTVTRPSQRCARKKVSRSWSKLLGQCSDQTEPGASRDNGQESTEPEATSAVEIEIDVAEDPVEFLMRESSLWVPGHRKNAMPHIQLIKKEPEDEYDYHSAPCEVEAETKQNPASHKINESKQEKDVHLCSGGKACSPEQFYTSELSTEIKLEKDMDFYSQTDHSMEQCHASELGMQIKQERHLDVHQQSEAVDQFHESELHMEIKQERDTSIYSGCESFSSGQLHDCEVDKKIKQEKDVDVYSDGEVFSSEKFCSSKLNLDIKEEKDLGVSSHNETSSLEFFNSHTSDFTIGIKQEKDWDMCSGSP